MKVFDKSSHRNHKGTPITIKTPHFFVIKNDKSELFFNQLWKWENKEENSLNEKLKSFILKRIFGLRHHYILGTTLKV